MHINSKQLFLFLCMSFLGFLFFSAALVFLPLPESDNQLWKGYHTILAEDPVNLASAEAAFLDSGFKEVIHHDNVEVEYFDFAGMNSIKLKDIPKRFEETDPRIDWYLINLPRYFSASAGDKSYSILYVKEKQGRLESIFRCFRVVRELGGNWRFVDVKPLLHILFLGLYGAVVLFVIIADRAHWQYLLAASLPWAVFIFFGGFLEFLTASLMFAAFSVFFRSYHPVFKFLLNHGYIDGGSDKARFCLIIMGAGFLSSLVLILTLNPNGWIILRFVFALTGMAFLFFSYNVATAYQRKRQEHRLFFRVPLARGRDRVWIYHLCIFTILVLSPAALKVQGDNQFPPVPAPLAFGDMQSFTPSGLEELNSNKTASLEAGEGEGLLPDIADYITHLAYQENFLLGRGYLFPRAGERVGISSFSDSGGEGIEKNYQELFVFSVDWFEEILATEEPGGLLGLWINQGNPVGAAVVRQVNISVSMPFLLRHMAFCLIIFVPMVFLNNRLTPQLMYGIKSLMLRRKQQAA